MEVLLAAHRPGKYNRSSTDIPQGARIIINVSNPDGSKEPVKAINVIPKQIEEEEVAITD